MTLSTVLAAARPTGDAFAAAGWFERLLTGPLGTSAAVIAVAWFGFELLTGRLSVRRGGLLVLGCFILFGAPGIARSLLGAANSAGGGRSAPVPLTITAPPPAVPSPPAYDPYAGASVPQGD